MNRSAVNNLKTELLSRMNYIIKIHESIEEDQQYDAFITMCDNHMQYCQFWADKLKPKWYQLLSKVKKDQYKDYFELAQYTLDRLSAKVNAYKEAVQEAMEQQEYYDTVRRKLETEFIITKELQDHQYESIRIEEHKNKIGFIQGKPKQKKKRSNKKKDVNND